MKTALGKTDLFTLAPAYTDAVHPPYAEMAGLDDLWEHRRPVEAVEDTLRNLVAVQWHPENMSEDGGDRLFVDLVERARTRSQVLQ